MITLPTLPQRKTKTETTSAFLGYHRAPDAPNGALYDTENLSARRYPHLATRSPRGLYAQTNAAQTLIAHDPLCYIDGSAFVIGARRIEMGLTVGEKQTAAFGGTIVILPDRKYIRPADGSWGDIDAQAASPEGTRATLTLCRADGSTITPLTAPAENPKGGELWLDTSDLTPTLYRYAPDSERWERVPDTYIRLHARGIGAPFRPGDGITLRGLTPPDLKDLNATHLLIACGEDHLVFRGILKRPYAQTAPIIAERRMPDLDCITAVGDRLWGAFCGTDEETGETVCHLRASRAGDPFNWNGTDNSASDPVTIPLPPDGAFTGACDYLGAPLFFREARIHRVTGSKPTDFRVRTLACDGVEAGSAKSLCLIGKTLYYKSPTAVCAYRGDLPEPVSAPLGDTSYHAAAGGALGEIYYISMEEENGIPHLFTLDTRRGIWYREDTTRAKAFAGCRDELYYIDAVSAAIRSVRGSGSPDPTPFTWMAETAPIAANPPDRCRLSRIDIRLCLPPASRLDCFVEYDSGGIWQHLHTVHGQPAPQVEIPIRPRPCHHLRLRLVGRGEAEILSITKTLTE